MKTLLCGALLALSAAAGAQNTIIVQPNPALQGFADNVRRSEEGMYQSGQQLGQALRGNPKDIVALTALGKCGIFDSIQIIYRDGSTKVIADPRRGQVMDADQLDKFAATHRGFSWSSGEEACQ